jgi:methyl-accepting chemotaxis protein
MKPQGLQEQYRRGDDLMVAALALYALVAVVLLFVFERPGLSVGAGLAWVVGLSLPGLLGYLLAKGQLLSRILMPLSVSSLVALHIQVSAGMLEFHFGVFITLALMMVYLDWRPILISAGFFAVHHVGFDRLQDAGWGLYCLSEPSFGIILIHAGYVVVQTLFQTVFVVRLANRVRGNAEVSMLADQLQDQGRIVLDVSRIPVEATTAVEMKKVIERIAQAMQEVRNAALGIGSASAEVARGSEDLSMRTEQAASSLEETASSMEEITATVRQSADTARQANQMAGTAARAAAHGGQVVQEVVTTMAEINQSSQKIADIIGVIDGIAFQTNILALNAAVEAARAGEQGRGFAVVAQEVRTLAQRSANAAKEIKELIDTSVSRVQAGTELVARAGSSMQDIVQGVERVSQLIGEISTSATEQSDGVAQVNIAVGQLDQMTQQNAALVEESAAAAESLKDQAASLLNSLSVFHLGDQRQALPR